MPITIKFSQDRIETIKLAKSNFQEALWVLTNESSYGLLSYEQVIEIVASHTALLDAYLKSDLVASKIDGKVVSIIADQSEENSRLVLSKADLRKHLLGVDLAKIGSKYPDLVPTIVNNRALYNKMQSFHLAECCQNNSDIAIKYLNKHIKGPQIFTGGDLAIIGKTNSKICDFIKNNKELLDELDGDNLAALGAAHTEFALHILENANLKEKLGGYSIAFLGRKNLGVAKILLSDLNLVESMGPFGQAELAAHHPDIANLFLQNEDKLKALTAECWIKIASKNIKTACKILGHPTLSKALSNTAKVEIASRHPQIAEKWMDNPIYANLFSAEQLTLLALRSKKVVTKIIIDERFRAKLTVKQVSSLALVHPIVFNLIRKLTISNLNNIFGKLSTKEFGPLCGKYNYSVEDVQNNPEIKSQFNEFYQKYLDQKYNLVNAACQLASDLRSSKTPDNPPVLFGARRSSKRANCSTTSSTKSNKKVRFNV